MCSGQSFTACSSSKMTTYPIPAFNLSVIFIFFAVFFSNVLIVKCLNFVIRKKLQKIPEFFSLITIGLPASHLGRPMRAVWSPHSLHLLGKWGCASCFYGVPVKGGVSVLTSWKLCFPCCTSPRLGVDMALRGPFNHVSQLLPPSSRLVTPQS